MSGKKTIASGSFILLNFKWIEKKHIGKYVCFKNFDMGKIIAYDKNPIKAIAKAKKLGCKNPVIHYVRDPKVTYI